MPTKSASLAAVIVTFNRPDYLERCIGAVLGQTLAPQHIVIVDNCSDAATAQAIAHFDDPRLVTARIEPNIGSAGAINVGIEAARNLGASHVWMGDDDCMPARDCFERQWAALLTGALDVATAIAYADDGSGDLTYPWRVGGLLTHDAALVLKDGLGLVNEFPTFWGMAMAPIAMFDALGPFKSEAFIWGDEIEYAQRIKRAGLKFAVAEGAIAYHPRWKGNPDHRPPWGAFPFSPAERMPVLYRNRAMWTRDDKGFLRGLSRAVVDGGYFLFGRRQPLMALRIWAYAFDGLFDTYALPPSRAKLARFTYTLLRRERRAVPPATSAAATASAL